MNRREFLQRGAMATAAVVTGANVPVAALTITQTASGPIPFVLGQRRMNGVMRYVASSEFGTLAWESNQRFEIGETILITKWPDDAYIQIVHMEVVTDA